MDLDYNHWIFQVLGIGVVVLLLFLLLKYFKRLLPNEKLMLLEETSDCYIQSKYWMNFLGSTFNENTTYLKLGINAFDEVILQTKGNFSKGYNSFVLVSNVQELENIFYYSILDYEIRSETLKIKIQGKLMNIVSLTVQIDVVDIELLTKIGERLKVN